MGKGYAGLESRETARLKERHELMDETHDDNNAFVREHQAMTAAMGGRNPVLDREYEYYDACMVNDGEHAQKMARHLTDGLNKKAFPVK